MAKTHGQQVLSLAPAAINVIGSARSGHFTRRVLLGLGKASREQKQQDQTMLWSCKHRHMKESHLHFFFYAPPSTAPGGWGWQPLLLHSRNGKAMAVCCASAVQKQADQILARSSAQCKPWLFTPPPPNSAATLCLRCRVSFREKPRLAWRNEITTVTYCLS